MALRNLLHKSDLEAFLAWLVESGGEIRPVTGAYQIVRIIDSIGEDHTIYTKLAAKEHLSVPWTAVPLVEEFYRHKKAVRALSEFGQKRGYDSALGRFLAESSKAITHSTTPPQLQEERTRT